MYESRYRHKSQSPLIQTYRDQWLIAYYCCKSIVEFFLQQSNFLLDWFPSYFKLHILLQLKLFWVLYPIALLRMSFCGFVIQYGVSIITFCYWTNTSINNLKHCFNVIMLKVKKVSVSLLRTQIFDAVKFEMYYKSM